MRAAKNIMLMIDASFVGYHIDYYFSYDDDDDDDADDGAPYLAWCDGL